MGVKHEFVKCDISMMKSPASIHFIALSVFNRNSNKPECSTEGSVEGRMEKVGLVVFWLLVCFVLFCFKSRVQ